MVPLSRNSFPMAGILRVPVHALDSVVGADGSIITGSYSFSVDNDTASWRNTSTTIVEWRHILIVALGCGASPTSTSPCAGRLPLDLFAAAFNSALCPSIDITGSVSPVYVLDLTPVYRGLPSAVKLGLDPRLTSMNGIPEPVGSLEHLPSLTVSSNPMPALPEEEAILKVVPSESCNITAPLRWHKIYSLGEHLKWRERGLVFALPPRDYASARYFDVINEENLEKDEEGNPFFDYPGTNAVITSNNSSRLKYPLLTSGHDVFSSDIPTKASYVASTPAGMIGTLGWLGVPSLMGRGFFINGVERTFTTALLEPVGAIDASVLAERGIVPLGSRSSLYLSDEDSAALDDCVMFWGKWSSLADTDIVPPPVSGTRSIEIPISDLPLRNLSHVIPNHPASEILKSTSAGMNAAQLKFEDLKQFHLRSPTISVSDHFPWLNEEQRFILDTAVSSWEQVVLHSAWGSFAATFETALTRNDGSVQWPGLSARVSSGIEKEFAEESVVLIVGGCLIPPITLFDLLYCG